MDINCASAHVRRSCERLKLEPETAKISHRHDARGFAKQQQSGKLNPTHPGAMRVQEVT